MLQHVRPLMYISQFFKRAYKTGMHAREKN